MYGVGRLAVCLACVACWGCQSGGNLDLVERELRIQEDRIYQLEDYIEEYQAMLESCRRENDALKNELESRGDTPMPPAGGRSTGPGIGTPPLRPPTIEGLDPLMPESDTPTPAENPGANLLPEPDTIAPAGEVHELVVNKLLTGGLDTDGRKGDEGVMVVVEPRDAEGHLVSGSGTLSLMVLDPATSEPVARWDFTSEETARAWRKSLLGKGLHFELPWPNDPPEVGELTVYVRLVTPDGRKLLASTDIEIDVPDTRSSWVAPRRRSAAMPDRFGPRRTEPTHSRDQWNLRQIRIPDEQPSGGSDDPAEQQYMVRSPKNHSERTPTARESESTAGRPVWTPYR